MDFVLVAVGVAEVDAQGEIVVADADDLGVARLELAVDLLEVLEGGHLPCHVVEAETAAWLTRAGDVGASLHEGNLVAAGLVGGQEAGSVAPTEHDGEAENVAVELFRLLYVADGDVDVAELYCLGPPYCSLLMYRVSRWPLEPSIRPRAVDYTPKVTVRRGESTGVSSSTSQGKGLWPWKMLPSSPGPGHWSLGSS